MPIRDIHRGPLVRNPQLLEAGRDADLSGLDGALVARLQVDGRASFAQLSRDFRVTEKTVRRRIAELRENGLIEITTVVDPAILGYRQAAFIGIKVDASRRASEVAEDVFRVPAVDYAVVTTGRYDLLVEVLCRDEADLRSTIELELRGRPGIRDLEVYPYLRLYYQQPGWKAAQSKDFSRRSSSGERSLDPLDLEIIVQLNDDGRVPFSLVAERLEVSETQIRKRYSRMVDSGAVRVMALTDPRSLGFHTMAWLAIVGSRGVRLEALADELAKLPSITYLVLCTGRFDIFAEVVCHDIEDLLALLDRDIRPMPELTRVEAMLCLDLYYRRVVPPV